MTKLLIACVIGAVVMFAWGFVYWVLLPTSSAVFEAAADEATLANEIRKLPGAGTYTVPGADLFRDNPDEYQRRHEDGPVAMLFVYPEGRPAMPPSTYGLGFLNMLVSVLLVGLLLRLAVPVLASYAAKLGFVVTVGLVGVVLSDLGAPIWWVHPWSLYVANALFHLTAWLLVGLVLGKLVGPPSQPATST